LFINKHGVNKMKAKKPVITYFPNVKFLSGGWFFEDVMDLRRIVTEITGADWGYYDKGGNLVELTLCGRKKVLKKWEEKIEIAIKAWATGAKKVVDIIWVEKQQF